MGKKYIANAASNKIANSSYYTLRSAATNNAVSLEDIDGDSTDYERLIEESINAGDTGIVIAPNGMRVYAEED